jgi:dTDP-L-rhamnose 4-epimerase
MLMKILITGGAGFIGKWVVEKLPVDSEVVIIDSIDEQVHKTFPDFAPEIKARAICIKDDIQNIELYKDTIEGTDIVIHLASQTGTGQSMYEISRYVLQNVNGTAKLLELIASLNKKPSRMILSSSRAVYGEGAYTDGEEVYYPTGREQGALAKGLWEVYDQSGVELTPVPMQEEQQTNPTSVYGSTKLWQEQLLHNYCANQNIDLVKLRFQNVYGPKQELGNPYTGIIGIFTSAITNDEPIDLFEDGLMTRDFVYVEDVAQVIVKCVMSKKNISTTINVGSGIPTTLKELVRVIAEISNKSLKVDFSGRFRVGDIRHAVSSMDRYEKIFGEWNPTSLKEGLSNYFNWYVLQSPLSKENLKSSFKEMELRGLLNKSN